MAVTQPTKGKTTQELIHIFNDQLSNHNKTKNNNTNNKKLGKAKLIVSKPIS